MTNHELYYETMYILRPDIAEADVNNHIEKYNKLLIKLGGKVLDSQMRGKRRLAYQISKHREGIYVQLSHIGDGQHISKLEKAMRLSDDVIRYMTVKQEGPLPTPKPSNKNNAQQNEKGSEAEDKKIEPSKESKEVSKEVNKEESKKESKEESKKESKEESKENNRTKKTESTKVDDKKNKE